MSESENYSLLYGIHYLTNALISMHGTSPHQIPFLTCTTSRMNHKYSYLVINQYDTIVTYVCDLTSSPYQIWLIKPLCLKQS